jgi:hypothetical protein
MRHYIRLGTGQSTICSFCGFHIRALDSAPSHLVFRTGDTNHSGAVRFRKLSGDRADASGASTDDKCLPCLGLADVLGAHPAVQERNAGVTH